MTFSILIRNSLIVALILATVIPVAGQAPIFNVDGRKTSSLDGEWQTIIDPYENGYYNYRYEPNPDGYFRNRKPANGRDLVEYDFDQSPVLRVPGDWNTQDPRLFFYEGTVWYKKSFTYDLASDRRLFVHFGAANYEAIVYLNGEKLGSHRGGFTPFSFEITDQIRKGTNDLIVKVDNRRHREAVPTLNTDWWNYGGLTRRVLLVEVPATYISDYFLQLAPEDPNAVEGWITVEGNQPDAANQIEVSLSIETFSQTIVTDSTGFARFNLPISVSKWTPDNPVRHTVTVIAGADTVRDEIGFRTIQTRGEDILLNGEPVFLKGISIHEEVPGGGRAHSRDHARQLLTWAKALGCNFVRLAHYPHNEIMVRTAEEMGLMVWSEIPVYWTILWDNEGTFQSASDQLRDMVGRDKNRAAVIVWSVGNETPVSASRNQFMGRLVDQVRAADPTRLISAATELRFEGDTLVLDDPLGAELDVIGLNEYIGWYTREPEDAPQLEWRSTFDKPLIITEFGAGALAGHFGSDSTRWTENYQASVYNNQIELLERAPTLRGVTPWILMDFRSPRRPLPIIQDYWNRKGLISETGVKKQAFFILRDWYATK